MRKVIICLFSILSLFIISKSNKTDSYNLELPNKMPKDFSFYIQFDFEGSYDSKTYRLVDGYNNDLDKECATKLKMKKETLEYIYNKLKEVSFNKIPSVICETDEYISPDYTRVLEIRYGKYYHSVSVPTCYLKDWKEYQSYKNVFDEIIKIIKDTDEFKSLPENQRFYL